MIAYSHIPKAGGSTLIYLLRAQFGAGHIDVVHRHPSGSNVRYYRKRDLALDLRIHPKVNSLAGHWLKPYIDFGELGDIIRWYTFVRDPASRSFSQYIQDIELGRITKQTTFEQWAAMDSLGARNKNAQVCQISGIQSCEAAIEVVERKNFFVGILEEYDLSLQAWRKYFGLESFSLNYSSPKNVRNKSSLVEEVRTTQNELQEQLLAHNSEDLSFYKYICEKHFPKQLSDLGGKSELSAIPKGKPIVGNSPQLILRNRLHRNLVYKPITVLDRFINPNR